VSQPDRHLLVVDDDDRIRDLLREFLARAGFRVTAAADAASAWRLVGPRADPHADRPRRGQ